MPNATLSLRITRSPRLPGCSAPRRMIRNYRADIMRRDAGKKRSKKIGCLTASVIDTDRAIRQHISVHDVFESNRSLSGYHEKLLSRPPRGHGLSMPTPEVRRTTGAEDGPLHGVLIVNLLEISAGERGKDHGLTALRLAMDHFSRQCSMAFIMPFPIQRILGDRNAAIRRLKRYYRRAGFAAIRHTAYMGRLIHIHHAADRASCLKPRTRHPAVAAAAPEANSVRASSAGGARRRAPVPEEHAHAAAPEADTSPCRKNRLHADGKLPPEQKENPTRMARGVFASCGMMPQLTSLRLPAVRSAGHPG